MIKKEYKTLGHKVEYMVPADSAEFNKLDPKRQDAANDEATANIVYRSMHPTVRFTFLHGLDAEECKKLNESNTLNGITAEPWVGLEADTGIDRFTEPVKGKDGKVRMKDGEEVTRFIESEERYYDRVKSTLVEQKKYASEDAVADHYDPIVKRLASYVAFDPTETERVDRGPKKLAAKYKLTAAKVLAMGNVNNVNANQLSKINKSFTPTAAVGPEDKMYSGTYVDASGKEVQFTVLDADADTLGWLIKEYSDWKANQVLQGEF